MATETTAVEALLKHERLFIIIGLVLLTALSWWWVLIGSGTGMSVLAMTTWSFPPPVHVPVATEWNVTYAIVMIFMWWIMMIAMMTPSAAPAILLYARGYRHERKLGRIAGVTTPTFAFALGYLLAWMGFSLVATGLQWGLERAGLMHAMLMWSIDPLLSAALLLAAGVYQLTPLKSVCLEHCRSPAQFLAANFRPGAAGALEMGLRHGAFCLGCCWMLMALLFAGGVMNLVWIAGLAILVLAEKVLPKGALIARVSGFALICGALWILGRSYFA
jgi:predicted metal-binding membrane protein